MSALAGGRSVPCSNPCISEFLLAKEFHWTLKEIDETPYEKIKLFLDMLSIYNRVQNSANKSKK